MQQAVAPSPHPHDPHGHGGASSLLRVGLLSSTRGVPATRLFTEQPLLLQRRLPTTQLNLFGPGGLR